MKNPIDKVCLINKLLLIGRDWYFMSFGKSKDRDEY